MKELTNGLGAHSAIQAVGTQESMMQAIRSTRPGREIDPGKVFDLELPLEDAADGYRAMDERRAVKTLLRP